MPLGKAILLLVAVKEGRAAAVAPMAGTVAQPGEPSRVAGLAAGGPVTAPAKALSGPPMAAKSGAASSTGGGSAPSLFGPP
eukprot:1545776-Alexandrium_andersonii.AAC.1